MQNKIKCDRHGTWVLRSQGGFTLVEMLIAMVVGLIIIGGAYSTYSAQSKAFLSQRDISKMQQNLRAACHVLAWDLHNSLRDPSPNKRYGFTSTAWLNDNPSMTFESLRLDNDNDMVAETSQQIQYQIADLDGDGRPGLYRDAIDWPDPGGVTGAQLVADGVAAFGLAYAFDQNGDGLLNRSPGGRILWAVDTDGNGNLDAVLDANDDGVIDDNDDADDNQWINNSDDALNQLPTPVTLDRVRAVRVFLLAVSERPTGENMIDRHVYTIGNRIIDMNLAPDRFKRRVLTFDVALRNYIR